MLKSLMIISTVILTGTQLFAQSVFIRGVRLTGSGCGPAAASALVTPDGKTMSVLFDNYSAEIGQGSANPQLKTIQKDCRVLIDVDVPAGFQYALQETDYRGFAALPASAYGFHRFTQVMPNQPIATMREAQLRGPTSGNYTVAVVQKPGRLIYSSCNQKSQTIELFSQLSVSYLPNSQDRTMAVINLDSVDTGVSSSFKLSWRGCK